MTDCHSLFQPRTVSWPGKGKLSCLGVKERGRNSCYRIMDNMVLALGLSRCFRPIIWLKGILGSLVFLEICHLWCRWKHLPLDGHLGLFPQQVACLPSAEVVLLLLQMIPPSFRRARDESHETHRKYQHPLSSEILEIKSLYCSHLGLPLPSDLILCPWLIHNDHSLDLKKNQDYSTISHNNNVDLWKVTLQSNYSFPSSSGL